ncbi:putative RNA-binding protein [Crocosphaera subtropica ATCC 51142]|uniref:RNA-binding protein n=1 Tax=Crocosphaera subtropica (strain ATCC 51142 / BH68) TaxID=43989 RepID=B1WVL3_CROS5|nr:hypothetical protein [Crocosphaera subtropica]ACB50600.1 putative RNA-binding protein [Crocosphaera subtropica ATCC 51142]
MKTLVISLITLLSMTLTCDPSAAFFHAGARGGRVSGGGGSWSGTGFRGGTASGGGGSWSGTGARGGTASGGDGSWSGTGARGGTASGGGGSWRATSPYGTTVNGGVGYGDYHGGTYSTYHPPAVVNHYGSDCYNCGGWAAAGAAAAGAAIGAASATATNNSAPEETSGSAYTVGAIYPSLPSGCVSSQSDGGNFYNCNGTWFSPAAGANGVYYRVVPAP